MNTGRPLDVNGNPLVPGEAAADVLRLHPANRQLFDVICSATKGIAATALGDSPGEIADACLLDIVNSEFPLNQIPNPPFPFPITPAMALSVALTGNASGRLVAGALAHGATLPPGSMVELNKDPADGPGGGFFGHARASAPISPTSRRRCSAAVPSTARTATSTASTSSTPKRAC